MSKGLVLIIEDDEWVSRLLAESVRDAGYEVIACGMAEGGLEAARASSPDCVICDIQLPDEDGYAVARQLRAMRGRVAVTPILFLSGLDDQASRLAAFDAGGDAYMTKPFRIDEVVAQVAALMQMAARLLRAAQAGSLRPPGMDPETAAISGDLSQIPIATVLAVLEMERRTGSFEVTSKKRRGALQIVRGFVTQAVIGGADAPVLTAMRALLSWNIGKFSFTHAADREPPSRDLKTVGQLLVESARLQDELAHENEMPLFGAPSLGGPASVLDDFAPPSSRLPRASAAPPPPSTRLSPRHPFKTRDSAPPARTGLRLTGMQPTPIPRTWTDTSSPRAPRPIQIPSPRVPGLNLGPRDPLKKG